MRHKGNFSIEERRERIWNMTEDTSCWDPWSFWKKEPSSLQFKVWKTHSRWPSPKRTMRHWNKVVLHKRSTLTRGLGLDLSMFLRDDFSSWLMQEAIPNSHTLPRGHPALGNNDWKCELKGLLSWHIQQEVSLWTGKGPIPTRANRQQGMNSSSRAVQSQSTTATLWSNQKQQ